MGQVGARNAYWKTQGRTGKSWTNLVRKRCPGQWIAILKDDVIKERWRRKSSDWVRKYEENSKA